jgi:hypothetical protein
LLHATLFFLASLLARGEVADAELFAAVDDVTDVATTEAPLFDDDDVSRAELRTAMLLLAWGWHESRWQAGARDGYSVGVVQVNGPWLQGYAPARVLRDRRLGWRLGLAHMRAMRDACGTVTRGLRAYASGRCDGAKGLVARRCAWIGGCQ